VTETRDGAGPSDTAGVEGWLTLPTLADLLGVGVTGARQLLRDRQVLAVRRDGVLVVPAELVDGGRVVKGLSGVLTDEEALSWLFRPDGTLPGRPVDALRENRGTEVRRRAQALGF
jgi:Rv2175c C-terminal domain of unknown function